MSHSLRRAGINNTIFRNIDITINSNKINYSLWDAVRSNRLYKPGRTNITFTNNALIGASSPGAMALTVPSDFSAGDNINVVNNGSILGRGGNGGNAGDGANNGGNGGTVNGAAMFVRHPVRISNNGIIAGGGGGGGGGAGARIQN